jgi:hypothetical protein
MRSRIQKTEFRIQEPRNFVLLSDVRSIIDRLDDKEAEARMQEFRSCRIRAAANSDISILGGRTQNSGTAEPCGLQFGYKNPYRLD